jgi:hypothetical protein
LRISIIAIIAIANGFTLPSSALTQPTDVGRFPDLFRGSCHAQNTELNRSRRKFLSILEFGIELWRLRNDAMGGLGAALELVRINDLRSLLWLLCGAAHYI